MKQTNAPDDFQSISVRMNSYLPYSSSSAHLARRKLSRTSCRLRRAARIVDRRRWAAGGHHDQRALRK
eukprot:7733937-Pyramimonas_sp.AAC.1